MSNHYYFKKQGWLGWWKVYISAITGHIIIAKFVSAYDADEYILFRTLMDQKTDGKKV